MEEAGHANRALVIEASDTLFNRRDYTAAQRFWSPHYIQHSAHIQRGRDAEIISTVDGVDFAYRRLGSAETFRWCLAVTSLQYGRLGSADC
jgi:hypothetical protein